MAAALILLGACKPDGGEEPDNPTPGPTPTPPENLNLIGNWNMEEDIDLTIDRHDKNLLDDNWKYIGNWDGNGNGGYDPSIKIMQDDKRGVENSRCAVIVSPDVSVDCGFYQTVRGLTPGEPYKATARIKTESVTGGGAHISLDYLWAPRSSSIKGSNPWTTVSLEFEPSADTVVLALRLGNTAADSRGVAYFDNVSLTYNNDLYQRLSPAEHLKLIIDKKYLSVSDQVIDTWLGNLDKVYEAYVDLFSGRRPHHEKTIKIRSAAIDAWAYAGNPIQWNQNYISDALIKVVKGDWCFGLMHEMGHDFAPGHFYDEGKDSSSLFYDWIWNEEVFANFRMYYAMCTIDGITIIQDGVLEVDADGRYVLDANGNRKSTTATYHGREIEKMYKTESNNCYDLTIHAGNAVEMGNGICYVLAYIADYFGWDIWKQTYDDLYKLKKGFKTFSNDWERIEFTFSYLDKHIPAGFKETSVWDLFTQHDKDTIKKYYSSVNNTQPINK